MLNAYDTLLQIPVSANDAIANNDNEAFRYECLYCGEEVFLAAQDSVYKATHFRHRSGNNDKECEYYLGQYGMVQPSPSIRNKKQEQVELFYHNLHKSFYLSYRFSEAEITAYEKNGTSIEVRSSRNGTPFFAQKINHENFCDDVPAKFILEEYADSYYLSNTSNNIRREYGFFGSAGPSFFKIQGEENDYTAKYIKSKSLYTNTKYFIAWPGRNTAQIRLKTVPGIKIDEMFDFKTMKNHTVWALVVTFTENNPQLDNLLQSWGYYLSSSEDLCLLWPPAYECNDSLYVNTNYVFVYSSFVLQSHGNTNSPIGSIYSVNNYVSKIDLHGTLKILKKNAELSIIKSPLKVQNQSLDILNVALARFVVPNDSIYYHFSSNGVERLTSGQVVFLTDQSYVIACQGNYVTKIISCPKEEGLSLSERILDAKKYYWVSIPFEWNVNNLQINNIEQYLDKTSGITLINKAVKKLLEEEKHE